MFENVLVATVGYHQSRSSTSKVLIQNPAGSSTLQSTLNAASGLGRIRNLENLIPTCVMIAVPWAFLRSNHFSVRQVFSNLVSPQGRLGNIFLSG